MKKITIPTNGASDIANSRNGEICLHSIQIFSGNSKVFIEGGRSNGAPIAHSGFMIDNDVRVLRELALTFISLATEAEKELSSTPNNDLAANIFVKALLIEANQIPALLDFKKIGQ